MRALVARLDSDGDVLLAGPAVRAIAAGSEHVTLLVPPAGEQAARLLPGVDEIIVVPQHAHRPVHRRAPGRVRPGPVCGDHGCQLAVVRGTR